MSSARPRRVSSRAHSSTTRSSSIRGPQFIGQVCRFRWFPPRAVTSPQRNNRAERVARGALRSTRCAGGGYIMTRAAIRDLIRVVGTQGWRLAAGQFVVGFASAALLALVAWLMTTIAPVVVGGMTLAQLIGWAFVASALTVLLLVPLGVAGYAAIVTNSDEV